MPVMKKTILYSLFIVNSINFSLHSQDINIQDNEDLLFVFDDSLEEIHPLEDINEIICKPEIQTYIHDLEFDPTAHIDILIEGDDQSVPEDIVEANDASTDIQDFDFDNVQHNNMNEIVVPQAPEDIIILDHKDTKDSADEQEASRIINPCEQIEECSQCTLDVHQLEELLNMQCQQMEQYLSDLMPISSPHSEDSITIPVDEEGLIIALNNGITLICHNNEPTIDEDDDIVPVPHDLINSVKKSTRQKKKLEKKEKAQLKKSKKKKKKLD